MCALRRANHFMLKERIPRLYAPDGLYAIAYSVRRWAICNLRVSFRDRKPTRHRVGTDQARTLLEPLPTATDNRSRTLRDDTSAEQRRVRPPGWLHVCSTTPDAKTGVSNAPYSIARLQESGHQATDAELMLTSECIVGVRNSWPSLYVVGGWEREHGTMMEAPPLGYGRTVA